MMLKVRYSTGAVTQKGDASATGNGTTSIVFPVDGQPLIWFLTATQTITADDTLSVDSAVYDGTSIVGLAYNSSGLTFANSGWSASYSNGSFTIVTPSGVFRNGTGYKLIYFYGVAPTVQTKEVKPSTGQQSIAFSGISPEPTAFFVIDQNSTATSSNGRVTHAFWDGENAMAGMSFKSNSNDVYSTDFSQSYSNGTLTLRTTSTSVSGYWDSSNNYKLVALSFSDEPPILEDGISPGDTLSIQGANVDLSLSLPVHKILLCDGLYMTSDIHLRYGSKHKILSCGGKTMLDNLRIDATAQITVSVTNSDGLSETTNRYITYNSTNYGTATSLTVQPGETIICCVKGYDGSHKGVVQVNGVEVFTQSSTSVGSYNWVVPDCTSAAIDLKRLSYTFGKYTYYYGQITITTA